ncbi:MAG: radical SAM protein, partial [Gloeomargaritaceae cyanobacterium C42_A2020_066]|nr:radical SAM protein [Gloeomargaritaceae cyanobacterium C42_A2020_066]
VAEVESLLTRLDQRFGLASAAEISMEIDPGTFDLAQLQGYRAAGVNRVSLGIQSFDNTLLHVSGRTHTLRDIDQALDCIHTAGLGNFNLDLIQGLPGQTLDHWSHTLEQALAGRPAHISVYDLTLEPGTRFFRTYQAGAFPLPLETTTCEMYVLAQETLTTAGFEHYEISNYARPGWQCRHNRVYWENRPYYAFGLGATSYLHRQRYARPPHLHAYCAWVNQGRAAGRLLMPTLPDSPLEILKDRLILGLRLAEGVDLNDLAPALRQHLCRALGPYEHQGWVHQAATHLRLTDPWGFLHSNTILVTLLEVLDSSVAQGLMSVSIT